MEINYECINTRTIIKKNKSIKKYNQNTECATIPISVKQGGTGISEYNKGDLIVATNKYILSLLSDVETNKSLTSNGINTIPKYNKIYLENMCTGTLNINNGGTNINVYNIGDILYASSTNILGKLSSVISGNVLLSGGIGSVPYYGKIDLTNHVSGILQPIRGGTGLTGYNIGDLIIADDNNSLGVINASSLGNILLSQGINNIPIYGSADLATTTTGILPQTNGGTNLSTIPSGVLTTSSNVYTSIPFGSNYNSFRINTAGTGYEFVDYTRIIKTFYTNTASVITCNTTIPTDNTIPQITEGTQVFALPVTPLESTSTLFFYIQIMGTHSNNALACMAVFEFPTANAIATMTISSININSNLALFFTLPSPGTSTKTYTVRIGGGSGTFYLNGTSAGAQLFSSVIKSSMYVYEISSV